MDKSLACVEVQITKSIKRNTLVVLDSDLSSEQVIQFLKNWGHNNN